MGTRVLTREIVIGAVQRITVTFVNASGAATAPTGTVTFTHVTPDGTSTAYTTSHTKPSTGVYYRDVTLSSEGLHRFRWEANLGADECLIEARTHLSDTT